MDHDLVNYFFDIIFEKLNNTDHNDIKNNGLQLALASFLANYYVAYQRREFEETRSLLNECRHLCERFGIAPNMVEKAAEACALGVSDIHEQVSAATLRMLIKVLEEYSYFFFDANENVKTTLNPWAVASCLNAVSKVSSCLELTNDVRNQAAHLTKKGIQWLFQRDVLCGTDAHLGWSSLKAQKKAPMLHDSAYILLILMLCAPNFDEDYETILRTILDCRNFHTECWTLPGSEDMDIVATCYCIQLLNAYVQHADRRPPARLRSEIVEATKHLGRQLCAPLLKRQNGDGSWPNPSHPSKFISTGLAIDALHSAGFGKGFPPIVKACNWLINNLGFFEGNWGWVRKDTSGGIQRKVRDSCISLSSLLKATSLERLSRSETAVYSLLRKCNEVEEPKLLNQAYILSCFADYLGAGRESLSPSDFSPHRTLIITRPGGYFENPWESREDYDFLTF